MHGSDAVSARTTKAAASEEMAVDMTPLIDVTFLLLAFFMIISVFNQMERTAELELPLVVQAVIEKDVAEQRMVVNIETDGSIVMFGRRVGLEQFKEQLKGMGPVLRRLGRTGEDSSLIIRGDKLCPYENVRDVLAAVQEENIRQVMFAAYEAKETEGSP